MPIPEKLPIRWMPDLHTSHVGRFKGREQFFLAHHRVALSNGFADYLALYCFDQRGTLSSHSIHGPLEGVPEVLADRILEQLGPIEFMDICVAPFAVRFEGLSFGLIPDAGHSAVTLEPGSMITFVEPWDGEFYT